MHRIDFIAPSQHHQTLLTILYCWKDGISRRGATMKNLSHSASFNSGDDITTSNIGTEHIILPQSIISYIEFKFNLLINELVNASGIRPSIQSYNTMRLRTGQPYRHLIKTQFSFDSLYQHLEPLKLRRDGK